MEPIIVNLNVTFSPPCGIYFHLHILHILHSLPNIRKTLWIKRKKDGGLPCPAHVISHDLAAAAALPAAGGEGGGGETAVESPRANSPVPS